MTSGRSGGRLTFTPILDDRYRMYPMRSRQATEKREVCILRKRTSHSVVSRSSRVPTYSSTGKQ